MQLKTEGEGNEELMKSERKILNSLPAFTESVGSSATLTYEDLRRAKEALEESRNEPQLIEVMLWGTVGEAVRFKDCRNGINMGLWSRAILRERVCWLKEKQVGLRMSDDTIYLITEGDKEMIKISGELFKITYGDLKK
jgi:hypothetical protein